MSKACIYKALLIIAIAATAVATSCVRHTDEDGKVRHDLPLQLLRDGDLVFRCGTSAESEAILKIDSTGQYTHVGIVINLNGKWQVVHVVPEESNNGLDRVKTEPIDTFFLTSRAVHGKAMRLQGCDAQTAHSAALRALEISRQGIPFDYFYNWNDTTRLYCTELMQRAYAAAGVDLCGNRSTHIVFPGFEGDIVLPGDIMRNDSLTTIFSF
ncbi:MAG: hypothetical protein IKT03_03385 [Muribaculaceae bacterium]|nr:hypothetical protein [Muribaculaceae bacterium]